MRVESFRGGGGTMVPSHLRPQTGPARAAASFGKVLYPERAVVPRPAPGYLASRVGTSAPWYHRCLRSFHRHVHFRVTPAN